MVMNVAILPSFVRKSCAKVREFTWRETKCYKKVLFLKAFFSGIHSLIKLVRLKLLSVRGFRC